MGEEREAPVMTLKFWFAGKERCWYYSLSPGTSGEKQAGAGEGGWGGADQLGSMCLQVPEGRG